MTDEGQDLGMKRDHSYMLYNRGKEDQMADVSSLVYSWPMNNADLNCLGLLIR